MEQIPILFTNQSFSVCSTVHVLLKVKKNFQKFHCIANKGQFLKKKFSRKRNTKICRKFKILQNSFCKACVVHFKWKKKFWYFLTDILLFVCQAIHSNVGQLFVCWFVHVQSSNYETWKKRRNFKCKMSTWSNIWDLAFAILLQIIMTFAVLGNQLGGHNSFEIV